MPKDDKKEDYGKVIERKLFKHKKTIDNSSLRIVSMSPSNLKRLLDDLFFKNLGVKWKRTIFMLI